MAGLSVNLGWRQLAVIALLTSLSLPSLRAAKPADAGDEAPILLPTQKTVAKKQSEAELAKLAEQGDPKACFEIGTRYLDGNGLEEDVGKAVSFLEKAARGGIGAAAFRVGKLYHDGELIPQDYERAVEFYTLAAQAGEMEAQHNLGAMLVSARGVKRDFIEGLAWLLVAKKAGDESDAEEQVRVKLAKHLDYLIAAEHRAEEILKDLPHAKVNATMREASLPASGKIEPPKTTLEVPANAPKLIEKPSLALPSLAAPEGFKITLPDKPLVALPEPKPKEAAKP